MRHAGDILNIMKFKFLTLLFLQICGLVYPQDIDIIIASIGGGYCSGSITKSEIANYPEIKISSKDTNVIISKIGLFSNNKQNYVEYWAKGGQLSSQMIDRILTLDSGDEIYFDVYVKKNDSVMLIHPLHLKINSDKNKACTCTEQGIASILGITHGKLPKEKLIKEGNLSITSDNDEIRLISYMVSSVIKGKKVEITCDRAIFNTEIKRLIHDSMRFQRIYFSEIKIMIDGKCYYMNPIEIQIE